MEYPGIMVMAGIDIMIPGTITTIKGIVGGMAQGNPIPAPIPAAGGIRETGKIDRHESTNTY
jgi:hypothetical protein